MFENAPIAGGREVRHDPKVAPFTVDVCEWLNAKTYASIPKYMCLTWGSDRSITLKTRKRPSAKGTVVFVNGGTPGVPKHGDICQAAPGTKRHYLTGRMLSDPRRRIVISGLVIAVAGVLVDGSILLGEKDFVLMTISTTALTGCRIISIVCKAIGLVVAFFGEVLKD